MSSFIHKPAKTKPKLKSHIQRIEKKCVFSRSLALSFSFYPVLNYRFVFAIEPTTRYTIAILYAIHECINPNNINTLSEYTALKSISILFF